MKSLYACLALLALTNAAACQDRPTFVGREFYFEYYGKNKSPLEKLIQESTTKEVKQIAEAVGAYIGIPMKVTDAYMDARKAVLDTIRTQIFPQNDEHVEGIIASPSGYTFCRADLVGEPDIAQTRDHQVTWLSRVIRVGPDKDDFLVWKIIVPTIVNEQTHVKSRVYITYIKSDDPRLPEWWTLGGKCQSHNVCPWVYDKDGNRKNLANCQNTDHRQDRWLNADIASARAKLQGLYKVDNAKCDGRNSFIEGTRIPKGEIKLRGTRLIATNECGAETDVQLSEARPNELRLWAWGNETAYNLTKNEWKTDSAPKTPGTWSRWSGYPDQYIAQLSHMAGPYQVENSGCTPKITNFFPESTTPMASIRFELAGNKLVAVNECGGEIDLKFMGIANGMIEFWAEGRKVSYNVLKNEWKMDDRNRPATWTRWLGSKWLTYRRQMQGKYKITNSGCLDRKSDVGQINLKDGRLYAINECGFETDVHLLAETNEGFKLWAWSHETSLNRQKNEWQTDGRSQPAIWTKIR